MSIPDTQFSATGAYNYQITQSSEVFPKIRVYQSRPDGLSFQVRYQGPTNENGKGVSRKMIAGGDLTWEQVRQLRDLLTQALVENGVQPRQEVFVLKSDADGTMRSRDEPFGVAVTTEDEAKCFVAEGGMGYTHSYEKLVVFGSKDDAINHWKENHGS